MQLSLPLRGPNRWPEPNPNAHLFAQNGAPKRLHWCSDGARLRGECPYTDRENPLGVCCLELVTQVEPVEVEIP